MPLKVFVSSSRNRELIDERNLGRRIIEELKLEPVMVELLPSSEARDSKEAYLDGVRLCDVYVGIVGTEVSPAAHQEFKEAMKLDKKCFVLVKKVAERQPSASEFLEHAEKCNCVEHSTLQEFSSHLEQGLLAFIVAETLRRLEKVGQSREGFVRTYSEDYVRPVLDEVKQIEKSLIDKRFVELPVYAGNTASKSEFFGKDSVVDQWITDFYSRVQDLNDLRKAAIDDHRQNVVSIMQEGFSESAQHLKEYAAIERLLIENFEFFLTRTDAYSKVAEPLLGQLEGLIKSIAPEHTRISYLSALWLVNKISQRRMLASLPIVGPSPVPPYRGDQYLDALKALHPEARRICEILQRVCQSGTQT
jgi:hypothetical protein